MAEASAGAEDDAGIPWAAAHTSGCGEQRQDREGGGEVWDEGGRMGQETGKGGDQREQREPKHLRRGRTRGVPVELRASRAGASRCAPLTVTDMAHRLWARATGMDAWMRCIVMG